VTALLLVVVFVPMLVEARRAARNERAQRSRGGIEPPGDVYRLMRVAYPAAFLVMIGEGFWRDMLQVPAAPDVRLAFVGLALFVAAKALKWWAIVALDQSWTFRVIVVPGAARVASGPYAYLRHPNYVAVVMELAAVALMSGARMSGPLATLAFGVLMMKRIAVEERALGQARGGR
jgi:methyltransferase